MAPPVTPVLPPEDPRAALLQKLLALSYEEREVTLSSGQKSGFYIDCKQAVLTGEGHVLLGLSFYALLQEAEQKKAGAPAHAAVGGLTMGADPLASATALTATLHGRELHAIYVRKEPKGHGTAAYLEGTRAVPAGSRVAVVEDVVTTGGASVKAIERLRAGGYVVDTVLAIVDRDAGGKDTLAALGCDLFALYSLQDFPIGQRGGR
jgi:orotate phosphoribosyltransferase